MSEDILVAMTKLFGIISMQDGGATDAERNFVIGFFKQELDNKTVAEYTELYDKASTPKKRKSGLVSMVSSVKVLSLCKRINKDLNQQQKVIVLVKLLEMLESDNSFTEQRMEILATVADVFNIGKEEYQKIRIFAEEPSSATLNHEDYLVFDESEPPEESRTQFINSGDLDGEIIFIRVKSVGQYFCKYTGEDEIFLNGRQFKRGMQQFAPGSVIKTPKGAPLYYSDLVNTFNSDTQVKNLSFLAEDIEFRFPNGHVGLREVTISEGPGNLLGIMGASGAGKTTLLNVLAGLETPYSGTVKINGFDIHNAKEKEEIEGVIGYVAQDDLLIEELTVYQNLYYNAKLCFKDLTNEEIGQKVDSVLESLGLLHIKGLVVGNVLNKKISGGQRKRLNIALELIREPAVMFVDEPTSGLSSRDSENVIDLLKELSLKGKLIFVVIHQPSSDIYKMFDKMFMMDTGGYPIFYGNPVEAVIYFKTAASQVGSDQGQCQTCGNVNPEQVFNIIEARVVNEYGEFTSKRKVQPTEWHGLYKKNIEVERIPHVSEAPPQTLKIPTWLTQTKIFTIRDFLSKVSNKQYMLINLLEAPFLALLLSLVIRYKSISDGEYIYRHNENIPAYILICIVVALFMGLTVSAEEIIRDKKIKKRESFLNLSRSGYLVSKLLILFSLSAIQTITLVLIGNFILEIKGVNMMYWGVLFTVSCHANVLGLNISSAFNSAVTVYIIIPLLLIPQMILSGAIFKFDKLNQSVSERGTVPLIADIMASRWAYEALTVEQYKGNPYYGDIFPFAVLESEAKYKNIYWRPELESMIGMSQLASDDLKDSNTENDSTATSNLQLSMTVLQHSFATDRYLAPKFEGKWEEYFNPTTFNEKKANELRVALAEVKKAYTAQLIGASDSMDSIRMAIQKGLPKDVTLSEYKDQYFSEQLNDVMQNESSVDKFVMDRGMLIQVTDPGLQIPLP
ncbi:MAG: ABC-type multidrug transport system ATPase subunit, partial [Bacteroidia bacterium]